VPVFKGREEHRRCEPGPNTRTSSKGRLEATVNLLGEGQVQLEVQREDLGVASAAQRRSLHTGPGRRKRPPQYQLDYEDVEDSFVETLLLGVEFVSVDEGKG